MKLPFRIPGLGKLTGRKAEELEDWELEDDEDFDAAEAEARRTRRAPDAGSDSEEAGDADEDDLVGGEDGRAGPDDGEEDEFFRDEFAEEEDEEDPEDLTAVQRARYKLRKALAPVRRKLGALIGTGRRRLIVLGSAGLLGLLLVGGLGAWLFLGGEPEAPSMAEQAGGEPEAAMPLGEAEEASPPTAAADSPGAKGEAAQSQPEQPKTLSELAREGAQADLAGIKVASVPAGAFAGLPDAAQGEKPLPPAPDPAMTEQAAAGPLPTIAPDGREPWQSYARPAPPGNGEPTIAVIVDGMGLAERPTQAAIRNLPGPVTLAFDPYGRDLSTTMEQARQLGHETLMELPMATERFPADDPGPLALQVVVEAQQNLDLLHQVLAQASGYVGVVSTLGSKVLPRDDMIRPVLAELRARGLMFVDGGGVEKSLAPSIASEIGLPRAMVTLRLDSEPTPEAIDAALRDLERLARSRAFVVARASPYPVTLKRLAAWTQTLSDKGLRLAPVSALADKQMER